MNKPWSHLPNAAHIDRVLESVKAHPESWCVTWGAVWIAARNAAWDSAQDMARGAARDMAWGAAWGAAWDMAWGAARDMAWGAARNAARDAILTLIAYDDSAKYLDMTPDQLKTWAVLSEEPAAVLLLPAVIAYEKISELETI